MTGDAHGTSAGWVHRTRLPLLTVGAFAVLALLLWLNAAINRYRFNVVLAVLASVPLAVVLIRAAVQARRTAHAGRRRPRPGPSPTT